MLYCRMIRLDGTAARRNPGRPGEVVGGIIKIWDWEHRESERPQFPAASERVPPPSCRAESGRGIGVAVVLACVDSRPAHGASPSASHHHRRLPARTTCRLRARFPSTTSSPCMIHTHPAIIPAWPVGRPSPSFCFLFFVRSPSGGRKSSGATGHVLLVAGSDEVSAAEEKRPRGSLAFLCCG